MFACPWILVPFRETEVDAVHYVRFLAHAHREVFWFDIPVNKVLVM